MEENDCLQKLKDPLLTHSLTTPIFVWGKKVLFLERTAYLLVLNVIVHCSDSFKTCVNSEIMFQLLLGTISVKYCL